jgi:hypothetical protein
LAVDQKGVKRVAQPQKECKTFNESRSNITDRERAPSGADAKTVRDGKGKMPGY